MIVYVKTVPPTETIAFTNFFICPAPKFPPSFFIQSGKCCASLNMKNTTESGKKNANIAIATIISIKQNEYFTNNFPKLYVKNTPMKKTIMCFMIVPKLKGI